MWESKAQCFGKYINMNMNDYSEKTKYVSYFVVKSIESETKLTILRSGMSVVESYCVVICGRSE
jgi:hypothetical protein